MPCSSGSCATAAKRGASSPTKERTSGTWSWLMKWIAKRPEALAAADVRAPFWVQTSTIGGSSETLVKEFAAMPQCLPSAEAVMIVTPVG